MTPEQVDDAGWSPEVWSSLNELAVSTVERDARVRTTLPEGPEAPNAYLVEVPIADTDGKHRLIFAVTTAQKVTRLRVDFVVGDDQLTDIPNIRALVQRAGSRLAGLEDLVLGFATQGVPVPGVLHPATGLLTGKSEGILDDGSGAVVFQALRDATKSARRSGYVGALNAVVGFDWWTDLAQDSPGARVSGLERAKLLLGASSAAIAPLPPNPATDRKLAVFPADPGVLDLVWTQRPRISHVETADGGLVLRLEEAFLLRVKESKAVMRVEGKQPPPVNPGIPVNPDQQRL